MAKDKWNMFLILFEVVEVIDDVAAYVLPWFIWLIYLSHEGSTVGLYYHDNIIIGSLYRIQETTFVTNDADKRKVFSQRQYLFT